MKIYLCHCEARLLALLWQSFFCHCLLDVIARRTQCAVAISSPLQAPAGARISGHSVTFSCLKTYWFTIILSIAKNPFRPKGKTTSEAPCQSNNTVRQSPLMPHVTNQVTEALLFKQSKNKYDEPPLTKCTNKRYILNHQQKNAEIVKNFGECSRIKNALNGIFYRKRRRFVRLKASVQVML